MIIGLYSSKPRSGKGETSKILMEHFQGAVVRSFAEPLKQMGITFLMQCGVSREQAAAYMYEDRETPIKEVPGEPTGRWLLQSLGTEWGRGCIHQELWVKILESNSKTDKHTIIDDMRFPNELRMVLENRGALIRIERDITIQQDVLSHSSEGGLDKYFGGSIKCAYNIQNDSSLEDLAAKVASVAKAIRS
ncbi:MAG: hypothetical protein F6K62_16455 [Sphaerospermopsis sp. SIO1G2]|nr:hypothetical protein [Sphaerospermopsis sp. SIO1G2]